MRHPLGTAIRDVAIPDGLRLEGYTAETDEEFRAVRNEAAHDSGGSKLSAEEWKVWAVNGSFRPELSFLLRDVETGTAAGVILIVSWDAETAATGIRDAYIRVIATRPAYEDRCVAEVLISHTLRKAQDQGYGRASVRIDADSASKELVIYESAGFVTQDTQVHYCIEL